mgnify:CR=1 FL=1
MKLVVIHPDTDIDEVELPPDAIDLATDVARALQHMYGESIEFVGGERRYRIDELGVTALVEDR